mmetsp:Transcript_142980/g.274653  ORF Transcript_142980/g.274653 Transcript_142980/m.274653 type:complete len:330 (+) Transcript_142980:50-1039(+)
MQHLGDYESEDENVGGGPTEVVEEAATDEAQYKSEKALASAGRRRIDYRRLPVSRPLPGSMKGEILDLAAKEMEPDLGLLQKAQAQRSELEAEKQRLELLKAPVCPDEETWTCAGSVESSESEVENVSETLQDFGPPAIESQTASWLPAPKNSSTVADGEVKIDFESAGRPKEKPRTSSDATSWLVQAATAPNIVETGSVPESILAHPLFSAKKARRGGASWEDLQRLRSLDRVPHIQADSMKDTNWHASDVLSRTMGVHRGKRVPSEVSMYESDQWDASTHANPSKVQKRKHQINWLAHEAMEKEAELLDRSASSRLTKAQTAAKYGW